MFETFSFHYEICLFFELFNSLYVPDSVFFDTINVFYELVTVFFELASVFYDLENVRQGLHPIDTVFCPDLAHEALS